MAALQILPEWDRDRRPRATLLTHGLDGSVFVVFSGDEQHRDPHPGESKPTVFAGYYVEPKAQDNPALPWGRVQVGVVGDPPVLALEVWIDAEDYWPTIWRNSDVT